MERTGDIINFNDIDRGRCLDLPLGECIRVDRTPGLHTKLSKAYAATEEERARLQSLDVMDMPDHLRCYQLGAIDHRLHNLSVLKSQLFNLASEEILAVFPLEDALPDIDVSVLH